MGVWSREFCFRSWVLGVLALMGSVVCECNAKVEREYVSVRRTLRSLEWHFHLQHFQFFLLRLLLEDTEADFVDTR